MCIIEVITLLILFAMIVERNVYILLNDVIGRHFFHRLSHIHHASKVFLCFGVFLLSQDFGGILRNVKKCDSAKIGKGGGSMLFSFY